MEVSALGAVIALVMSVILILRKVPPAYGMVAGALAGGWIGGASLPDTVSLMMEGAEGMIPATLRILAAGILAGVLMESGAATTIAEKTVDWIGEKRALLALAIATMLLTAAGVFIDVAVITVAPIALAIAGRVGFSKTGVLIAMIGGGKAGNLMSPNPNSIAAAEAFDVSLTSVMAAGVIPAVFGILVTYITACKLSRKGSPVSFNGLSDPAQTGPPKLLPAIVAPLTAIILLSLRPLAGIEMDPMVALPVGGITGALIMGKAKQINQYAIAGLEKMSGVAIMLLGTGTLAGIISNSHLSDVIIQALTAAGLPAFLLAPFSGAFMSAATASTTAGTVAAGSVFGGMMMEMGVAGLAAAAMVHAGATVFDHMPHGSFFHATGGSVMMGIKERMKLIPFESLIGLTLTAVSTLIFGVFKVFP
ncbi:GntP family permease [Thermoactinomyces sp. CICC 23799]|uniref:GntP family permease n=1 Tax=Thermoactinomyces sp. CICC 23799 TaxID=2767429 RepID=UPI0018DBAD62|nr:GntP family permease [Thermoactinomyces sp. CICC 23799]MBH8602546.1 GntP family permease [Thermoactinomyces sp. CICC 23799]